LEVRRDHFIPGFVDNLVGVKPGEEKEFDITFPEDYPNAELAGKLVHFHFKLEKIKTRQLPEANDEFAKSVSPFETMEELRKELRERLEGNVERKVREQVAIKIIDRLMPQVGNDVVPRSLHKYRTDVEIRRRLQQLEQSGLTLERFLADRNIDQQQWVVEQSVMGMLESRVEILLESIAKIEGLHPTDDEVEELLQVEAGNRGISVPQLRASIEKDGSQDLIRYALLRAKVMDFLFDNAKVEFVPPGTPIEEAPPAEEAVAEEKKSKAKAKAKKAATEEEVAPAEEAEAKPKAKKAREPKEPKAEESAPAESEAKPKARRASKKTDAE
jgi:trigger factor